MSQTDTDGETNDELNGYLAPKFILGVAIIHCRGEANPQMSVSKCLRGCVALKFIWGKERIHRCHRRTQMRGKMNNEMDI